jgi:hypothetical protein
MNRMLIPALLFAAVTAHAGSRVLVPIYLDHPVPGAYGSLWTSELALHNRSKEAVIIDWCSPYPAAPCILNLAQDEDLRPNETQIGLPARYPKPQGGIPGCVVFFEQPQGGNLSDLDFQLRVADVSRSALNAGTQIPVVRESEFRTVKLNLLNVPIDPRFRLTFRVYEMNLDRADFVLRACDQVTGQCRQDRPVTTTTSGPQGALRFQPAYVEVAGGAEGDPTLPSRVRVEVEPLTPGSLFWAFVSITNNDTQQITIVTP